jgi:hypothetical protein
MTKISLILRLVIAPLAIVLAAAAPSAAQLDGAFTLRASDSGDRVNLNLQYGDNGRSNYGRTFERSALTEVAASGERITFKIRRAAGTFAFEGKGSVDRASGFYTFTPDPGFRREMEGLGFKELDDRALFVFAMDDLSVAGVRQLRGLVSDPLDTPQLVRLVNHGAGVRYVQAMTDAGFGKLQSDEYRRARDHGVTPELVREMAGLGMKGSLQELIRLRDHGVTAEYVRAMRAAGHELAPADLVRARDHGVSAEFVKRMGALGYEGLPISEYVRMRDHGVTAEFVEAVRAAGIKPTASEVVRLRDHGVTADYVRRVTEQFRNTPTVEQIIRLRSRGELPK